MKADCFPPRGRSSKFLVTAATAASILAACGGSSPSDVTDSSGSTPTGPSPAPISVIYAFGQSNNDLISPNNLIQAADGTLYGATAAGDPIAGPGISGGEGAGNGGVFSVTPTNGEKVILSFESLEAVAPGSYSNLVIGTDGNFYGTISHTLSGGIFFKLTPTGVATTLYSFGASTTDGAGPTGTLVQGIDGNFYGITNGGGSNDVDTGGDGTVFKITPDGIETIIYSFGSTSADCKSPVAGLLQATDGNFYGVSSRGGAYGFGAVFSITAAGQESVLYSFTSSYALSVAVPGSGPGGTLIQANDGNFYFTTAAGGTTNNGTIFRITPQGGGSVLYSFGSTNTDGVGPGPLLQGSDGNLYGATAFGGTDPHGGVGTVFEVSLSGEETVLYSFGTNGTESYHPWSLLEGIDGHLYGTTQFGGAYNGGAVFMLSGTIPGK
jgi:uncharacterized repeat protein (TIGR03803 family)